MTAELKRIWMEAFGDSAETVDKFFVTGYSPKRCNYLCRDGIPATALYWFDCFVENHKIAYIYAVATHPDHRGNGLASRLIRETHAHLKALGYAGAVLKPAKGLFPFYERLGYVTSGYISRFHATAAREPFELVEISAGAYSSGRLGYLPPDKVVQRDVIMDLLKTFARFYAYYDSIVCVAKEEPVIFEYLGDPNLAPGFLAALGIREADIPTFGHDIPYTMFYPLNCTKKPGYLGITLE